MLAVTRFMRAVLTKPDKSGDYELRKRREPWPNRNLAGSVDESPVVGPRSII